jgi:two-component system, OmpR family, KDP operon response regulator KdpE
VPIIVLSARGLEHDKVAALDVGADDYLTKPFGTQELLARMRVALRRRVAGTTEQVCEIGDVSIDFAKRQVRVAGNDVHLTPTEYRLLTLLVENVGRVVTHTQLLRAVWGPGHQTQTQYVRVYMGQLRRKIERDPNRPRHLMTEPGVGYRFNEP